MSRTCRAGVFTGDERYEVRELTVPEPPPGGALLRVEACGLCGSDVGQWHGVKMLPGSMYPIVPGHEIVGTVERLGTGTAWGVGEGDRVAVDEVLDRGPDPRVYGYTDLTGEGRLALHGGYGEYMELLPGTRVHRLTRAVPAEELTLFEPLASALHWVDAAGVGPGQSVVILGPGHQGLAVLQAVLATGAGPVVVVGTLHDALRLTTATALGAHHVVDLDTAEPDDVRAVVREWTGGTGADVVFEVTPATGAVPLAVELAGAGGTVVLAGLKERRPVEGLVTDDIVNRGLRLLGAAAYTPQSMERAVALLNGGDIDPAGLRGAVLGLDRLDEALDLLLRRRPGEDAPRVTLRHGDPA